MVDSSTVRVQHAPRTAALLSRDADWNGADTYLTHFNGGRPYRVTIRPAVVTVHDNYSQDPEPLMVFKDIYRLLVGKSPLTPMTEFSGGHGREFDGNSILLQTEALKYVFIGHMIYSFTAVFPIVSYVSEVGNNDVPYPYATDERNNVYLMIENVIVNNRLGTKDPYNDLLYRSANRSDIIEEATDGAVNLIATDYGSGDHEQVFRISWQANAKEHYNRPWMSDLKAVYSDGATRHLSENDYIVMMNSIGTALGIRNMDIDILHNE